MSRERDGENEARPQLQIWDEEGREAGIGTVRDAGDEWNVAVALERVSGELVRGRLAFRCADRTLRTAPIIVEESPEAVLQRARQIPASMLRQLLVSVRD